MRPRSPVWEVAWARSFFTWVTEDPKVMPSSSWPTPGATFATTAVAFVRPYPRDRARRRPSYVECRVPMPLPLACPAVLPHGTLRRELNVVPPITQLGR